MPFDDESPRISSRTKSWTGLRTRWLARLPEAHRPDSRPAHQLQRRGPEGWDQARHLRL